MNKNASDNRMFWLALGFVAGLGLSYLWPHEPLQAGTVDSNDQFAMVTSRSGLGGGEAVFVLDFLTGRLVGAAISAQTGQFTQFYMYNVSADFGIDPETKPRYAITSGDAELPRRGREQFGASLIYVAELKSGGVVAYGFPYQITNRPNQQVMPMLRIGTFSFRDAAASE